MIEFCIFVVSSLVVSISGMSQFVSKYEPIILQRKVGHIDKLQYNVKPTMMPNPRGFFVVNNDKMYVDFWAQGRHFQLILNRGSPEYQDNHPNHIFENVNNTKATWKPRSRDLDFFTGYLKNHPRFEAFGYISVTRSGEETLVLSVNLGTDTLHIENSEYIVGNPEWFNTVAYLRRDVAMKNLEESPFRSRNLLGKSKQEVIDYYNSVEQYNYSVWDHRPMNPKPKACVISLLSDWRVYEYFGKVKNNVHNFFRYAITMARFAFRKHDFDMDGISDNFCFILNGEFVTVLKKHPKSTYYHVLDHLLSNDNNKDEDWLSTLATFRRAAYAEWQSGSIIGFTLENMGGTSGVARPEPCCDNASSAIINFKKLVTPSNVALVFTHHLIHFIGAKDDPDKCIPSKNKNITLGKYLSDNTLRTYDNVNNLRVSPCKMIEIQKNIKELYERKNCLVSVETKPICGNGIREKGEACDCGDMSECERIDKCCVPVGLFGVSPCHIDNVTRHYRLVGSRNVSYVYQCSKRTHAECCDDDCQFVKSEEQTICRFSDECQSVAYCDGASPICPDSAKKDGFPCDENTQVCVNGDCDSDICKFKKLKSCICENSCLVCCEIGNGSSTECEPVTENGESFFKPHGSHCGWDGYCTYGKCIEEDTDINTHVPEPFQPDVFDLKDWYSHYWYLFIIATIILMVLITLATAIYKRDYKNRKLRKFDNHLKEAQKDLEGDARLYNASPETKMQASRLLALFPTAPHRVVIFVATRPGNEGAMVLKMLRYGFPMRRITG